ncbi:MAG: 2,3-bisphosphoglycerate-independent phosphoglycerate mutase [Sphingobacteriia bacterium]|nr:2,3-bisphosphoglycerate-independent phosphoglycerate mutase [Sphingobacteriia bacterium]
MQKVLLCILDGFGHNHSTQNNAIHSANTPYFDYLFSNFPHSVLETSGLAVGLPEGQMGNSEVGHMSIGSGRIILQDLPRIDQAIENNELKTNKAIEELVSKLKITNGTCHLIGLLSDGGVHSHQNHIIYLAKLLSEKGIKVNIHAFLDGRDTSPQSATKYVEILLNEIRELPNIQLSSIMGRFYGMDRDKRWERIQAAYDCIVSAHAKKSNNFLHEIKESYLNGIFDEFIVPTVHESYVGMNDNDAILMCNFRADRVRQILKALLEPEFDNFPRSKQIKFSIAVGMMEYSDKLSKLMNTIFENIPINNTISEIVSTNGIKQLRIAETEKYAHVTFFFNGGIEAPVYGETRALIPSPQVMTYDQCPEMSAFELTDRLIDEIEKDEYGFIVVNYANGDMVGHSGNFEASVKAVEVLDNCLSQVISKALKKDYVILITADHGNVEQMENNGLPHTAHTLNPVPFIVISENTKYHNIQLNNGRLCDIAPTILKFMGIQQPSDMTGKSLITEQF